MMICSEEVSCEGSLRMGKLDILHFTAR
jgi:hypothetical protein